MASPSQFPTMFGLVVVVVSGLLSMTAVTASTTHSIKWAFKVGALQRLTANDVEVGDMLYSEKQVIIVEDIVVDTNSGQSDRRASSATGVQTARRLLVIDGQAPPQTEDKPADDESSSKSADANSGKIIAKSYWAPGDPNCVLGFC